MLPQQQRHLGATTSSRSKSKQPFFFLALLLVAVLMSVSNIRGAVKVLPVSQHQLEMMVMMDGQPPKFSRKHQQHQQQKKENINNDQMKILKESTTTITHSKGSRRADVDNPLLLQEIPNNDNTVISLVSMGRLVDTYLVERCIRSIRTRGKFTGYILVFTDQKGYVIYNNIVEWDDKVKIIQGWEEDLLPMENVTVASTNNNDQNKRIQYVLQPKRYAQQTMIFKRFKTHHAKYIAADPDLGGDHIRFVLYIDCDNIIGKPLDEFFLDYTNTIRDQYEEWKSNVTTTAHTNDDSLNFGFFSMFRDKHLKGKMHSGIIFHDLKFDDRCTRAWRKEMDEFYHGRDQTILLNVIANYTAYHCKTFVLPQQYFSFATKRVMNERKADKLPTFIHVTEYRLRRINEPQLHREFFQFVLDLDDNNKEQMIGGVAQEQLVYPWAVRTNQTSI